MNNYPSETGSVEKTSLDSAGHPSEKRKQPHAEKITGMGNTAAGGNSAGKGKKMPQASGTLRGRKPGESFLITKVLGQGALRQHFLDMGLLPGSRVTVMKYAPMGDPMEIQIHGYELTIRLNDADKIIVIPADSDSDTGNEQGNPEKSSSAAAGEDTAGTAESDRDRSGSEESRTDMTGSQPAGSEQVKEQTSSGSSQNGKTKKRFRRSKTEHPGFGEEGRFHHPGDGDPLPKDTLLTFALVGNQNSGKTTLFNQLTGSPGLQSAARTEPSAIIPTPW